MEHVFAAQLRSLEQISLGQQQQTAVLGRIGVEQIEQLRSISNTMDALLSEMEATRQTQAQGLALQQAMLAREVFQDKMEEFVYQFQKMIAEFLKPESEYPPSTQYYLLDAMFKQIEAAGISTAVIKGRDNKAAFDGCVTQAKTLYLQLAKHPEVQQAITWAENERKRRLIQQKKQQEQRQLEEQRRREERNQEILALRQRIEELNHSLFSESYEEWLAKQSWAVKLQAKVPITGFAATYAMYKAACFKNKLGAKGSAADQELQRLKNRLQELEATN